MIKRVMGLLMALGMMLGLGLVAAAPASAGTCSTAGGVTFCGHVRNNNLSVFTLLATCDYGNPWSSVQTLQPGQAATCKDTDGFLAKAGYYYSYQDLQGGTLKIKGNDSWIKITDVQNVSVKVTRS